MERSFRSTLSTEHQGFKIQNAITLKARDILNLPLINISRDLHLTLIQTFMVTGKKLPSTFPVIEPA